MNNFSDRPVYKPEPGETWKCECGASIGSLPFPPRKDAQGKVMGVRCPDCYRKYRDANPRPGRRSF